MESFDDILCNSNLFRAGNGSVGPGQSWLSLGRGHGC